MGLEYAQSTPAKGWNSKPAAGGTLEGEFTVARPKIHEARARILHASKNQSPIGLWRIQPSCEWEVRRLDDQEAATAGAPDKLASGRDGTDDRRDSSAARWAIQVTGEARGRRGWGWEQSGSRSGLTWSGRRRARSGCGRPRSCLRRRPRWRTELALGGGRGGEEEEEGRPSPVRASAPGSTGRLVGGEPPVAVSFEMDGRTDWMPA